MTSTKAVTCLADAHRERRQARVAVFVVMAIELIPIQAGNIQNCAKLTHNSCDT